MTHVARELGISIDSLRDWIDQARHDPRQLHQLHEGTSETVQAELVRLLALAPVGKGWVVTEDGLQGVVPPHHDPAAFGSLPEPVATREMEDLVTCGHTLREVPANSPAGFGRTRSSGNSRAWATVTMDGPVRFTIRRDRPPRASALPG